MAKIGAKERALREQREAGLAVVQRNGGPMTRAEAKDLTRRIKDAGQSIAELLTEAHDRKAWLALGYTSWREYAEVEFGISQSRAYQLFTKGRVERQIQGAANSTVVEISERESRDLAPNLTEVTSEIRDRVEAGESPEDVVPDVVQKHRPKKDPTADAPDPVAEWERTSKELAQAQETVRALQSDDTKREIANLRERLTRLEGRLQQEMTTRNAAENTAKRWLVLLSQIQKAVNAQSFDDILPAIEDLRR